MLIWDSEVTPSATLSFNFFKANPWRIVLPKKVIGISWQWYGSPTIYGRTIFDYDNYVPDDNIFKSLELINEKPLLEEFLEQYEKADIVIGHNVRNFDIKHLRTRAAALGIRPIHYPHSEDTLAMLRTYFKIESNKLDYACQYFGIKGKTEDRYDDLIDGCLKGDPKKWALMKKYCNRDVEITAQLYNFIAPWHTKHFNLNKIRRPGQIACKWCGAMGDRLMKKGCDKTPKNYWRQKYLCKDCGHRFRGERIEKEVERVYED